MVRTAVGEVFEMGIFNNLLGLGKKKPSNSEAPFNLEAARSNSPVSEKGTQMLINESVRLSNEFKESMAKLTKMKLEAQNAYKLFSVNKDNKELAQLFHNKDKVYTEAVRVQRTQKVSALEDVMKALDNKLRTLTRKDFRSKEAEAVAIAIKNAQAVITEFKKWHENERSIYAIAA